MLTTRCVVLRNLLIWLSILTLMLVMASSLGRMFRVNSPLLAASYLNPARSNLQSEEKIVYDSQGYESPSQIYIANPNGSNPVQLTDTNTEINVHAKLSPDGSKILFARGIGQQRAIYVMDVNGDNQRAITNMTDNNGSGEWSPDSSKIVYSSDKNGTFDLFVVDVDGENERQLTFDELNDEIQPAWDPSGAKIGYTKLNTANSSHQLWTTDIDGETDSLFCNMTNASDMEWSPDGTRVAYLDATWPNTVWVMNDNCSEQALVTGNGDDADLIAWSPKSDMLVYSADSGTYFIRPDGSERTKLSINGMRVNWRPANFRETNRVVITVVELGESENDDCNFAEDVTISAGDYISMTNAGGMLTLDNLSSGKYTIIPQKDGWQFIPISRTFEIPLSWDKVPLYLAFSTYKNDTVRAFEDEFDDESKMGCWNRSSYIPAEDEFSNTWAVTQVVTSVIPTDNGITKLNLESCESNEECAGRKYKSGEYVANQPFGFGCYEARFRPTDIVSGTVTSFFLYDNYSRDEIDIEIVGKNGGELWLNYWKDGCRGVDGPSKEDHCNQSSRSALSEKKGRVLTASNFNFTEFHNYGFRWTDSAIDWYVDGRHIASAADDETTNSSKKIIDNGLVAIPDEETGMKAILNLWSINNNNEKLKYWTGELPDAQLSLSAEYDWVRFIPEEDCSLERHVVVKDHNDQPLESVMLKSSYSYTGTTDSNGIARIFLQESATITPSLGGYIFSPPTATVPSVLDTSNITFTFTENTLFQPEIHTFNERNHGYDGWIPKSFLEDVYGEDAVYLTQNPQVINPMARDYHLIRLQLIDNGGMCSGFSYAALALYNEWDKIRPFGNLNANDFPALQDADLDEKWDPSPFADFLVKYHMLQDSCEGRASLVDAKQRTLQETINLVKQSIDSGLKEPYSLLLRGTTEDKECAYHEVFPYDYVDLSGTTRLLIYDSNHPYRSNSSNAVDTFIDIETINGNWQHSHSSTFNTMFGVTHGDCNAAFGDKPQFLRARDIKWLDSDATAPWSLSCSLRDRTGHIFSSGTDNLLVTDSQGRRFGGMDENGMAYDEIPGAVTIQPFEGTTQTEPNFSEMLIPLADSSEITVTIQPSVTSQLSVTAWIRGTQLQVSSVSPRIESENNVVLGTNGTSVKVNGSDMNALNVSLFSQVPQTPRQVSLQEIQGRVEIAADTDLTSLEILAATDVSTYSMQVKEFSATPPVSITTTMPRINSGATHTITPDLQAPDKTEIAIDHDADGVIDNVIIPSIDDSEIHLFLPLLAH